MWGWRWSEREAKPDFAKHRRWVRAWGAAVLRPYMKGCAIDCGKTQWPGGASPAPPLQRGESAAWLLIAKSLDGV
jgi:hypothetical protein